MISSIIEYLKYHKLNFLKCLFGHIWSDVHVYHGEDVTHCSNCGSCKECPKCPMEICN